MNVKTILASAMVAGFLGANAIANEAATTTTTTKATTTKKVAPKAKKEHAEEHKGGDEHKGEKGCGKGGECKTEHKE